MAKQSGDERNAGLDAVRIPLALEALEQRILLSNPGIGYLSDSPDPVNQGSVLTLIAHSVIDLDGDPISSVQFYRSTDNVADPLTDTLLGNGVLTTPGNYQWTGAASWASGNWYYFAIAKDPSNNSSAAALSSGRVNALPTIGGLTGGPQPTGPGMNITLTASGVADSDGTVAWVDFYHDANGNGLYDVGDTFLGRDSSAGGGWTLANVLVQWTTGDYFARARDNDGAFSTAVTGHVDQMPVITSVQNNPNPIVQNQVVTFSAMGVSDPDGSVNSVAFYRDVFDSGHFNPTDDQFLGFGTNMGGGVWSLTVLASWQPDVSPLYFAVATDNEGYQGNAVWTLNQNPSIDGVGADPNPATLSGTLDLTAFGVQDTDGYVHDVVFSVASPPDWWPFFGSPTDQHQDSTLADDWTWNDIPIDWTITDIVKADFNNDGFQDLAVTVDLTSGAGTDFLAVLTNNGNGVFTATSLIDLYDPAIGMNYNPSALAVGDFNEDNFLDIVVANPGTAGNRVNVVSVALNDGTGMFAGRTDYAANFAGDRYTLHPNVVGTADFNADGHLDIVAYSATEGEMPLWLGDGTGVFALNRIYSYGSSRWIDGNPTFPAGSDAPPANLGIVDMLVTDLDQHEDGGPDIAMVGPNGLQLAFNYLRTLDTAAPTPNDFDIFSPGNVIGRAQETGIAGGVAMSVGYNYNYRTGTSYTNDTSRTDDYNHLWLHDGNVDMFHVYLNAGQTLSGTATMLRGPDSDAGDGYCYIYDAAGTMLYTVATDPAANPDDFTINFVAPGNGDYYVAIAGFELVPQDDVYDPFTGYWQVDDTLEEGGADTEYTLVLTTDGVGPDRTPRGAGESITAADFMDDDYNNNQGLLLGTNELVDLDLATSSFADGSVTVFLGDRYNGVNDRMAYGSFHANYDVYDLGGRMPTSIAAYNIDSDTFRDTDSEADWDWAQGSTGEQGDGTEMYNDLVTTNSDGSLSILINNGDYSANFGIHEFAYSAAFDGTEGATGRPLNYEVDNNAFGGPFQSPIGIVVGDFNGDGLATFAVAEQYDVGILRQGFPFQNSDPLDLNQYGDEVPQTGLPFDFSSRYSVVPSMGQRGVTYYATAFDEDYGYPNNLQYEGYSTPASTDVWLNQMPLVWSLTTDRRTLSGGDTVTLTANGVQDLDGYVAEVEFYLYDGSGPLDPTQDTLLGTDVDDTDGWTWAGPLGATTDIFYARAIDNNDAAGLPVASHVNTRPTIGALYVDGVYNSADDALILGPLSNGDLGIRGTYILFNDANVNNRWDSGEEVWVDANSNGYYDEESQIYLGGNGTWDTAATTVGSQSLVRFADKNFDGKFEWNEGVWEDANHNDQYDTGETILWDGGGLWLAQNGDAGIAGNVYRNNANGEVWADTIRGVAGDAAGVYDGIMEQHVYDGGDGWQTRDATLGVTANMLFHDTSANGIWDPGEGIWAEEVMQGQQIVLTAVDVMPGTYDTGNIRKVEFYRDSNYNGVFDPDTDYFMGRGVDIGAGRGTAAHDWRLELWVTDPVTLVSSSVLPMVDWSPGSQKYFAVAQDGADDWSTAASARDNVLNLPPKITGLLDSPDPVTQGQNITLTASGVEDQFGQVHSVSFYLDMNGNGTIEEGTDRLLGVDESPAGGWKLTTLVDWSGGPHTYMARVTDNYGATVDKSTTGNVNLPPSIGSMTINPDPVHQGEQLTLQALSITDPDSDPITKVEFYRDSNSNGKLDVGVDDLLDSAFVTYPSASSAQWQGAAAFPVGNQLYFARAQDSRGGWSAVIGIAGRVENAPPTIGALVVSPDPVTQGYNLTLTAQNVTDSNGSVMKVEFYRDSDHNGSLGTGTDTLLGTVSFAEGSNYALTLPVIWESGLQLYFARAQDNEGEWSTTAFAQGTVNARPAISTLTASPSPLVPGDTLTLTATGVTDADGSIARVSFYRDTNGDGVYQDGLDVLIGSDTDGSNGWSLAFTESSAVRRFFARAQDNAGGWSLPAQVDVQRRPTIGSLTDFPDPVNTGQNLRLTAVDAQDIDGTIDRVEFYLDLDANGIFNPALDQLLGTDTTPGDGWSISLAPTWGGGAFNYFARARDNEGNYSLDAYAPMTTGYVDFSPEMTGLTALPNPVNRGDTLTFTGLGVTDADGTVTEVDFYRDANGNGTFDDTIDEFLGRDTNAAGGWTLAISTAGWPLGNQTYFARARDDQGAWSTPVSTVGRVNGLPLVGSLQDSPDPVVRGDFLNLLATNVNDLDGTVTEVRFYRDENGNGNWDAGDLLLATDSNGADGWQVTVSTAGWTVGTYAYFARAVDNDGGVGTPATTVGTVTTAPSLVIALQPASDTGASQVDGITTDTTPTFDFVVNDPGTIDIDWNNDGTFDATIVAGSAGTYSQTSPVLTEGPHTIAGRFTDDASNVTNATKLVTIDTVAPGKPDAPDLQALSDNGLSDTDNVTSILTPTFDITNGDAYLRFFRNGVQISGDFEPDSVYTTPVQPLGSYNYTVQAVDAAGNVSPMSDPLAVTFTGRPATPAAPDLQAGSDSGVSSTDNITNVLSPVFNISSTATYFRLWRDGTLISGAPQVGATFTAVSEPEGVHNYTVTSINLAGEESLHSAPLMVTIDRTAPTLTDPNISVILSTDNGIKGLAEFGDVVTITWDNSALGDNNSDVSSVAVDLTQYGAPGQAAMYDDGTHGDATAGDGIWTLDYTITSTNIAMQSLNVDVYATDIAGNVGVGHDTSGIRVRPKLIAQAAWQGFDVSIYDVDGNADFNPEDIAIKLGKANSVKSIVIGGTGAAEGLGISISGATSVGSIKDARKGPLGNIAFIASDAPIKSIQLKSGMEGYNLNDQTFGGLNFASDIDGDGDTTDPMAIYSEGPISKVKIGGSVMADVWIGGVDPKKGMAYSSFGVGGNFHGDLSIWGSAGKTSIGGNFGSSIYIDGFLSSLQIGGNMTSGAHVFVSDLLAKLSVGGSLLGNAPEDEMVQILAGAIGKGSIGGNVWNSRILAGADLGADWAVGGAGADADSFNVGQISSLGIGGNVTDSTIGAGLISHAGGFDLAWLAANNAFLNGSAIGKLSIGGSLTSSAAGPVQPFGVGSYLVGSYKIGGSSFSPLVFTEV